MKIRIVLGLGYGDEGKGNVVNALANKDSIVIRINGGTQAGHTVVHEGLEHTFSAFGSGTLKGAETYLSEYCAINPQSVMKEYAVLNEKGIEPEIYMNADTMIITPWDVVKNRRISMANHAFDSVGVGFGTTIDRNEKYFKLTVRDFQHHAIADEKIKQIDEYYGISIDSFQISKWMKACYDMMQFVHVISNIQDIPFWNHKKLIFEGGQGIMLDMDYGFFPHVTRSNCTSKNVFQLMYDELKMRPHAFRVETYYVTRAYATRHGDGLLLHEEQNTDHITPAETETNITNSAQGKFRYASLDLSTLRYALECDYKFNRTKNTTLVVTCLDQIESKFIPVYDDNGTLLEIEANVLGNMLGMDRTFRSNSREMKIYETNT